MSKKDFVFEQPEAQNDDLIRQIYDVVDFLPNNIILLSERDKYFNRNMLIDVSRSAKQVENIEIEQKPKFLAFDISPSYKLMTNHEFKVSNVMLHLLEQSKLRGWFSSATTSDGSKDVWFVMHGSTYFLYYIGTDTVEMLEPFDDISLKGNAMVVPSIKARVKLILKVPEGKELSEISNHLVNSVRHSNVIPLGAFFRSIKVYGKGPAFTPVTSHLYRTYLTHPFFLFCLAESNRSVVTSIMDLWIETAGSTFYIAIYPVWFFAYLLDNIRNVDEVYKECFMFNVLRRIIKTSPEYSDFYSEYKKLRFLIDGLKKIGKNNSIFTIFFIAYRELKRIFYTLKDGEVFTKVVKFAHFLFSDNSSHSRGIPYGYLQEYVDFFNNVDLRVVFKEPLSDNKLVTLIEFVEKNIDELVKIFNEVANYKTRVDGYTRKIVVIEEPTLIEETTGSEDTFEKPGSSVTPVSNDSDSNSLKPYNPFPKPGVNEHNNTKTNAAAEADNYNYSDAFAESSTAEPSHQGITSLSVSKGERSPMKRKESLESKTTPSVDPHQNVGYEKNSLRIEKECSDDSNSSNENSPPYSSSSKQIPISNDTPPKILTPSPTPVRRLGDSQEKIDLDTSEQSITPHKNKSASANSSQVDNGDTKSISSVQSTTFDGNKSLSSVKSTTYDGNKSLSSVKSTTYDDSMSVSSVQSTTHGDTKSVSSVQSASNEEVIKLPKSLRYTSADGFPEKPDAESDSDITIQSE